MRFKWLLLQHIPQLRTTTQPRPPVVDVVQPIECLSSHLNRLDGIPTQDARTINGIVES